MLFNGKYWHKPGHLGMTTAEVKEALQNGASLPEITPEDAGKPLIVNADGEIVIQEEFVITITMSGANFITTTTPEELTAAVRAGKKIKANIIGFLYDNIPVYLTSEEDPVYLPIPIALTSHVILPNGYFFVRSVYVTKTEPITFDVHTILYDT